MSVFASVVVLVLGVFGEFVPDICVCRAGSLDDIMTQALIENKVDFVRLLLQNSVVMKEYLTVSRLRKLYNEVIYHSYRSSLCFVKCWLFMP